MFFIFGNPLCPLLGILLFHLKTDFAEHSLPFISFHYLVIFQLRQIDVTTKKGRYSGNVFPSTLKIDGK